MLENILIILFFLLFVAGVGVVLFRLARIATGLLILGVALVVLYVEVYGGYLLITQPSLYLEDFSQHGWLSFSTVFIGLNLVLLISLCLHAYRKFSARTSTSL